MSESIYKSEYMSSIFRYIENNLSTDFDIALLSNVGYVSYDKFYRDFYSITGHAVKEYVRKRRLSNALALIKASDLSITDIALQCGYSSHQALCRAVKQTLGLTPSEYKIGGTYYFFPPFSRKSLQSVIVLNEIIPKTLCIRFYCSILTNIENITVNSFLQAAVNYNGRIFGRNGKQKGSRFCYELYLTNTDINYSELKKYGFEIIGVFPCFATLFVATTVQNEEQKINSAWDYIYSEWLQNSMFEYTGEPYYEEYILRNAKPIKLKLYLPIRRRTEEMTISLIENLKLHFVVAKAEGYNAEKNASKTVIDYLANHHPHVIKTSKELYLRKEANGYVCGVRVNSELCIINSENTELIYTEYSNYLELESNVMGDYDRYVEMLRSFVCDNGMDADINGIFAVYDATESFDKLKIKMYCPVKFRKK